jgi:hypothetical protein
MQPYTYRYIAYFTIGLLAEMFVIDGGIGITLAAILVDLVVELVRMQYASFKQEQKDIIDALKKSSNS